MIVILTAFESSPDRGQGLARDMRVRQRLDDLARHPGDAPWLDGAFSVADLMMVTVLRRSGVVGAVGGLYGAVRLCGAGEARPAYQRAFADQLAVFEASGGAAG